MTPEEEVLELRQEKSLLQEQLAQQDAQIIQMQQQIVLVLATWDIRSRIHRLHQYNFLLLSLCLWEYMELSRTLRTALSIFGEFT